MNAFVWIAVGIWSILLVIAILALFLSKKRKAVEPRETNYQAFFAIGIAFFPLGLVFMILALTLDFPVAVGVSFFAIGITYLTIGLSNRNKWKKEK